MTLLITLFAAIITTIIWYTRAGARELKIGTLGLMFWGASIMWTVDAIFGFAEEGADFFVPTSGEILNDAFLGFSVVALGLLIWTVIMVAKDPKGIIRSIR